MSKNEKEISKDLDSQLSFDPYELAEIVSRMLIPYESTFNKGEKFCLGEDGCYIIPQKPPAL
jgi:hypothetical protein